MDIVLGDITPIKLGPGYVAYRRRGEDDVRGIEVTSATIFGLVVVAYYSDCDGRERRVTFPLASLVEHTSEAK